MTYKLDFLEEALAEWNKLNPSIKQPLKRKLIKVLENPHIPKKRRVSATYSSYLVTTASFLSKLNQVRVKVEAIQVSLINTKPIFQDSSTTISSVSQRYTTSNVIYMLTHAQIIGYYSLTKTR